MISFREPKAKETTLVKSGPIKGIVQAWTQYKPQMPSEKVPGWVMRGSTKRKPKGVVGDI